MKASRVAPALRYAMENMAEAEPAAARAPTLPALAPTPLQAEAVSPAPTAAAAVKPAQAAGWGAHGGHGGPMGAQGGFMEPTSDLPT